MKKAIFFVTFFVIGLLVIGFPIQGPEAAPKILIRAVTGWPITHVGNDMYKEFIKRVNEKSKGEIEIKLLGGPEVVPAFDQLKAAGSGTVDLVHGGSDHFAGLVPENGIICLASPESQVPMLRESGVMELMNQAHLERGKVVFLGGSFWGMPFYIMTNKPVSKLDDVRALKLRSIGGMADVVLGELGASVVKISSAETYEGLQRGIVDGALRNTISMIEFKEYEVMKYIVYPPIITPGAFVIIGEGKWNTIPKHLQTMIKEEAIVMEKEANKYYYDMDKVRLKEAQEKYGMKVIHLSDKDIKRIHEVHTGADLRDWFFKKSPKFGPPIYDKVLPFIK